MSPTTLGTINVALTTTTTTTKMTTQRTYFHKKLLCLFLHVSLLPCVLRQLVLLMLHRLLLTMTTTSMTTHNSYFLQVLQQGFPTLLATMYATTLGTVNVAPSTTMTTTKVTTRRTYFHQVLQNVYKLSWLPCWLRHLVLLMLHRLLL